MEYTTKIDGKVFYFRIAGSGPPLVLLHASPMSSSMFLPFIEKLSDSFTVIAPDTPGYGLSDPLSVEPRSLSDYTTAFHLLFQRLGLEKFSIYGSATGAQLGIRYALEYPDRLNTLYLDNVAHFSESEVAGIMDNYFPDFNPKADGSHIQGIWNNVIDLFEYFPWCNATDEYRLNLPYPPPPVYQYLFFEYLLVCDRYDLAYKLAFKHEDKKHIHSLTVPTEIFRWESSIVKKYTDRIFEDVLAENIRSTGIASEEEDRYGFMANKIKSLKSELSPSVQLKNVEPFTPVLDQQVLHELASLPPFPKLDMDGKYLMQAWSSLAEFEDLSLDQKNKLLYAWSKSGILA